MSSTPRESRGPRAGASRAPRGLLGLALASALAGAGIGLALIASWQAPGSIAEAEPAAAVQPAPPEPGPAAGAASGGGGFGILGGVLLALGGVVAARGVGSRWRDARRRPRAPGGAPDRHGAQLLQRVERAIERDHAAASRALEGWMAEPGAARAVAMLLLAVDRGIAAELLRHIDEQAIADTTAAMRRLRAVPPARRVARAALREALKRLEPGRPNGRCGRTPPRRRRGTPHAVPATEELAALAPGRLVALLDDEPPQLAALLLARLDRAAAAGVLRSLDPERRADVVQRIATIGDVSPEAERRAFEMLRSRARQLGAAAGADASATRGPRIAATLLNHIGGDPGVLAAIGARQPTVARAIREQSLTFEDLRRLDGASLRRVLAACDPSTLALALKAASGPVEQAILCSLGPEVASAVLAARSALGATPLGEALAAQGRLVETARALVECGESARPPAELLV